MGLSYARMIEILEDAQDVADAKEIASRIAREEGEYFPIRSGECHFEWREQNQSFSRISRNDSRRVSKKNQQECCDDSKIGKRIKRRKHKHDKSYI